MLRSAKEKIIENTSENNSDVTIGKNIENSEKNIDKDLSEVSEDDKKIQKSENSQAEIN